MKTLSIILIGFLLGKQRKYISMRMIGQFASIIVLSSSLTFAQEHAYTLPPIPGFWVLEESNLSPECSDHTELEEFLDADGNKTTATKAEIYKAKGPLVETFTCPDGQYLMEAKIFRRTDGPAPDKKNQQVLMGNAASGFFLPEGGLIQIFNYLGEKIEKEIPASEYPSNFEEVIPTKVEFEEIYRELASGFYLVVIRSNRNPNDRISFRIGKLQY